MAHVPASWDDFRFVLALKRTGSLAGAAQQVGCEPAALSERITALAKGLGVALVEGPDATLTEAGKRGAELAETFERGVEEMTRRVPDTDDAPEGTIKLATTEGTAMFLMAGLAPFRKKHPKLTVDLLVANVTHDLLKGEADLALRMFHDPNPELISEKVGDLEWSVFASRAYLAKAPVKTDVKITEALVGHAVLGFAAETTRSPGGRWVAANVRPEDITKRTGNMTAIMSAAKNGLGLAVLPALIVRDMPDIVRVTPEVVARSEAFVVFTREQQDNKRVRLVFDAVATLFTKQS